MIATRSGKLAGEHGTGTTQFQTWISTATYQQAVGVVTGLQDDVDSGYSMRRCLEEAIANQCRALEEAHRAGKPWPEATRLVRGGINPKTRAAGDVVLLQSWVGDSVRARCYGTVNGIKADIDRTYTLRTFVETALHDYTACMERKHNTTWEPRLHLRRGRRF